MNLEFIRIAKDKNKDYSVDYRLNGKPMHLEVKNGICNDPAVLEKYSWWELKLMAFKLVDYGPHNMH